jgi:transcriptional regulator with XRE-family HTH domain
MYSGVHLTEIIGRIDIRLKDLRISASEAERRCGRRDAIRNMRRASAKGSGSVTARTLTSLAPALSTTAEWLLTGHGKKEADEVTELIPSDKLDVLSDDHIAEAFGWAFQAIIDRGVSDKETRILANAVLRIIRVPELAFTQAERRHLIQTTAKLFRHPT